MDGQAVSGTAARILQWMAQMTTARDALEFVNGTKVGLGDVVRVVAHEFRVTESEFVDYRTRTELSRWLNRSIAMPWYAEKRVKGLEQTEQWFAFKLARLRAELEAT